MQHSSLLSKLPYIYLRESWVFQVQFCKQFWPYLTTFGKYFTKKCLQHAQYIIIFIHFINMIKLGVLYLIVFHTNVSLQILKSIWCQSQPWSFWFSHWIDGIVLMRDQRFQMIGFLGVIVVIVIGMALLFVSPMRLIVKSVQIGFLFSVFVVVIVFNSCSTVDLKTISLIKMLISTSKN